MSVAPTGGDVVEQGGKASGARSTWKGGLNNVDVQSADDEARILGVCS